ncbi:AaceriACR205Wp [[Ashbya] aceris (nom. inval.)]|nr:AaceriACR205Wp [[Ashbya] aceris (nom. inval.)]
MSVSHRGSIVSAATGGSSNRAGVVPSCTRCTLPISTGHAYELGGDRWHTHCFTCYKCDKELTCDSDFLVLGTGTLICFACSDSCKGCGKKIDDLAIILSSSNEAYCSECFKCCKCDRKIEDLRYAKTKKGLFCISCHERLLAKRKYAEEKKRRLQKELPIVPGQPGATTGTSTPDHEQFKIPVRSAARPVSPRRLSEPRRESRRSSSTSENTMPSTKSTSYSAQRVGTDSVASDIVRSHTSQGLGTATTADTRSTGSLGPALDPQERHIKSNSWSVVAQFLEDDDDGSDYGTNTDAPSINIDKHSSESPCATASADSISDNGKRSSAVQPTGKSIGTPPRENANDTSSAREQDIRKRASKETYDVVTPKSHTRNLSVDDVLQRTLTKDYSESTSTVDNLAPPVNDRPRRFPLNKTPLRNRDESPMNGRSPVSHRRGLIMSESGEFINELLASPNNVEQLKKDDTASHEHVEPPPLVKGLEDPVLQKDNNSGKHFKVSGAFSFSPKLEVAAGTVGNQNHLTHSASSSSLDPKHARPLNGTGNNSGNGTPNKMGSKLARSASVRSKVASLIHGKKTPTRNQAAEGAYDTHTGWGVSSMSQQHPAGVTTNSAARKLPPHGRGQSDSTIYNQFSPTLNTRPSFDHQRSHSGTTGATNVAIHMTPPLNTMESPYSNSVLERKMSVGRNHIVGRDALMENRTPTNEEFVRRDIISEELQLRQLKLEINDLQYTKTQLTSEVDQLKKLKEHLQFQVDQLKTERKDLQNTANSVESLDDVQEVVVKQAVTANTSSNLKPRFWKFFSGKPSSSTGSASGSSGSGPNTGNPQIGISHPVLQNPNEFDDWNLKSVNNGSELYGSTLESRVAFEGTDIPMVITTCMRHIESKVEYLTSEGLYRKSGSQLLIEQIESEFTQWKPNTPPPERLLEFLRQDIHAVSGVLKRYLRKLPNPLFTFEVYEPLMQLVRDEKLSSSVPLKSAKSSPVYGPAVEKLAAILKTLPHEHLRVLTVICQHVNRVAQYQEANLMNMNNLALVFAPGIIRDYTGEKDIIDMRERNYLIGFIFMNYEDIFAKIF